MAKGKGQKARFTHQKTLFDLESLDQKMLWTSGHDCVILHPRNISNLIFVICYLKAGFPNSKSAISNIK